MKSIRRWFFIILLLIINPHHVFLDLLMSLSRGICWVNNRLDDLEYVLKRFYNDKYVKWPVFGQFLTKFIDKD